MSFPVSPFLLFNPMVWGGHRWQGYRGRPTPLISTQDLRMRVAHSDVGALPYLGLGRGDVEPFLALATL